jgi:hypothetical protein
LINLKNSSFFEEFPHQAAALVSLLNSTILINIMCNTRWNNQRILFLRNVSVGWLAGIFCLLSVMPPDGFAQTLVLPHPGAMVNLSLPAARLPDGQGQAGPGFTPTIIRGMTIDPTNPFAFDFIIDEGDSLYSTSSVDNPKNKANHTGSYPHWKWNRGEAFKEESTKLIKYFLAALTVPEDQMWVNLSPYEKDRIIPRGFGQTELHP